MVGGQAPVSIVGPSGSIKIGGDDSNSELDKLVEKKRKELVAEGGPDAAADLKELDDLMRKLKNGDISDADKEKLAGILGIDVKELDEKSGGQPKVKIEGPSGTITVGADGKQQ